LSQAEGKQYCGKGAKGVGVDISGQISLLLVIACNEGV